MAKIFPDCRECKMYEICYLAEYVKDFMEIVLALAWPNNDKLPINIGDAINKFYRNIVSHCKDYAKNE